MVTRQTSPVTQRRNSWHGLCETLYVACTFNIRSEEAAGTDPSCCVKASVRIFNESPLLSISRGEESVDHYENHRWPYPLRFGVRHRRISGGILFRSCGAARHGLRNSQKSSLRGSPRPRVHPHFFGSPLFSLRSRLSTRKRRVQNAEAVRARRVPSPRIAACRGIVGNFVK